MDNLVKYYVRQAGGGGGGDNGVGPIYVVPPFVQRGNGTGSFLSGLFRAVRPILWSGAKLLGKEALRTGGKILTGIVDNPNVGASKIISRNVTESLKNLRAKMSGQGQRKRKRGRTTSRDCKRNKRSSARPSKRKRTTKTTKRDIFS